MCDSDGILAAKALTWGMMNPQSSTMRPMISSDGLPHFWCSSICAKLQHVAWRFILKSWGSEATPSATHSFKRSYKISQELALLPDFHLKMQKNGLLKFIFCELWQGCQVRQSIRGCLYLGRMTNFVRSFEWLGRRRCRFQPSSL